MKEDRFEIKSYGFGQLAQLYYPDRDERSAVRLFREEMKLTRGLWDAIKTPICHFVESGASAQGTKVG